MRRMHFLFSTILFVLSSFLLTFNAAAQSDRGTIAGTVLDSSGAVVAGAEVTAKGTETGALYKTISTANGAYRIPDMQLGVYNITVTAPGFKSLEQKGVVVQINSTVSLDLTMQPGTVTETLTVVADAPSLQSESSDIGTVVSTRQIQELPLAVSGTGQSFLRSPETFVFLTPGTTGPGSNDDPNGIFQSKIGGGQNFGNEVILDGASTARADSGSAFDQTAPSVEALQEFKVTTSTVPAEFGRTSGGVESFSTRSGTNSFHGSAFDIFRNTVLDANTWFNNFNGAERNIDRKNDYGGTFGGPVWIPKLYNGRDKTFFFFSWEQFRQAQGSTGEATVPTTAEQGGDFSALVNTSVPLGTNPCDGTTVYQGQIFDPETTQTVGTTQCRTAFSGNIIPSNRFSTVAKNILAFIPAPSNSGTSSNFIFPSVHPVLDTAMTIRVDQNLGSANKVFFSLSRRDQSYINGTPSLPIPLDGSFSHPFITDYYRVGWDHSFTPTMINHLSVGLNRIYNNNIVTNADGTDWPAALGITGASGLIFPVTSFSGGTIAYTGFSSSQYDANFVNSLVVAESVGWVHGRHSIRVGFDWRSFQYSLRDESHQSPSLDFFSGQTSWEVGNGATGDPFASFLLGDVNSMALAVRSTQPKFINNYYAGYVQDDFKIRHNLMLNFGLRYEVETPRHEAHDAQSVIDLTATNPGATGVPGALIFGKNAVGAKSYYKNIGPRIGFAYAPDKLFGLFPQTVLRGGYAIYYAGLTYGDFGQSLTDGFTASKGWSSSNDYDFAFDPLSGNRVVLDTGVPAYTPPPNLDASQLNGQSGFGFGGPTYVAKEFGRPGMIQNWSLEFEHQLATDLILSVGYIGAHGTRLRSSAFEINNLNPKYFSLGAALNANIDSQTATDLGINPPFPEFESLYGPGSIAQALRPFPQYQLINSDCCLENLGQSTYHALTAKVERRFRNGLNLLASYTFSKTLTDADSALPAFANFTSGIQNSYNLRQEKSLSIQDIPHTFVLSYIYELPFGKGKKLLNHGGVVDKIVGGWQIGGVQRYQSGQPLIFGCATGIPGYDGCIRYSRVPGQPLLSPQAGNFNGPDFLVVQRHCGGLSLPEATADPTCNVYPDPQSPSIGCQHQPDGTFTAPAGVMTYFNCAAFTDPNFAVNSSGTGSYLFGSMPRTTSEVRSSHYFNEDFSLIKRTTLFERHALIFKAELPNAFNRHTFTRPDTGITNGTFGVSSGSINPQRSLQLSLRYEF